MIAERSENNRCPAYAFFDVLEITDAAKMETYRAGMRATVERYGGRYLIVGGPCAQVEGTWKPAFPVLIEFPNLEQAHRWYNAPEYAELKALRLAATRGHAVFLDGTVPSSPGR